MRCPTLSRRQLGWLLGAAGARLLVPRPAHAAKPIILVFLSDTSARTLAISSAFKAEVDFAMRMTYDLSLEEDAGAFISDQIRGMKIALVLAIGERALQVSVREFATTPVIYADVDPSSIGLSRAGLVGITGRVDPDTALDRLSALMPSLHTLGSLRASEDNDPYWDALAESCSTRDIALHLESVSRVADLKNACEKLYRSVDFTWLQRTASLWTGTSIAQAFHVASTLKAPIAGFARSQLEVPQPPAMVILSSPAGIGQSAGAKAREVLSAGSTGNIYVEPMLIGHLSGLRNSRIAVTRKNSALFDELVR